MTPIKTETSVEERLDRLEESIELVAQMLAQGRNIARLGGLASTQLAPVGHRLVEIVREVQRERSVNNA